MRRNFDNQKTLTGHDNDAVYFRDDSSSVGSSRENIHLGPFVEFGNELDKDFPRVNSQVPLSPRGDEDDRSYQYSEAEAERGTWTGKFDFLLSLLGYSVGLGNVWRFPYLCYSNGGGAFLIPFILMMLLAGLPLMFMELSFGQYASLGPIAIFEKFCPLFSGLGYGMVIVSCTVMLYYNMIIAWTIFYMFVSWNSRLPWDHCSPEWSTYAYTGGYPGYLQVKPSGSSSKPGGLIIFTGNQPVPKYLLNGPFTVLPGLSERLAQDEIRRLDIVDSSSNVKSEGYVARATGKSVALIAPSSKNNRRVKKRRFRQRNNPELQNRRNSKRVASEDIAEFNLRKNVESFQSRRNDSFRLSEVENSAYKGISSEERTVSKDVPSRTNDRLELVEVNTPSGKSFPPPTVTIKRLPPAKEYPSVPAPTRKIVPADVRNQPILQKNLVSTSNPSFRADNGKKPNTDVFLNSVYPGSVYKSKPTPGYYFPVPALVDNFQPPNLPKDAQYPVDVGIGLLPEVFSLKQDLVTTPSPPTKSPRRVFKTPSPSKGIVYSQPEYPSTKQTSVIVKPYQLPELAIGKVLTNNQNYLPEPTKPVLVSKVYRSKNSNSKSDAFAKADPYAFGYGVYDGLGTSQYRQESSSGDGQVRGNYGYQDFQGMFRQVEYVADDSGFHAVLKSNEPGLGSASPADVSVILENPPPSVLINS